MKTTRKEVLRIFGEDRLIAVIRAASAETAERAARVLSQAGIRLVEITLTVPGAIELIGKLAADADFTSRSVVGAGTVLAASQAGEAIHAGARFLVSPVLFAEMVEIARKNDAMSMPGTMTPTEMVTASALGADLVKIYPIASLGGPAYVTQVRRTLAHLALVATGNIGFEELAPFLATGLAGFGIGDPLVRPDLLEKKDTAAVITNAKRVLEATRRSSSR